MGAAAHQLTKTMKWNPVERISFPPSGPVYCIIVANY